MNDTRKYLLKMQWNIDQMGAGIRNALECAKCDSVRPVVEDLAERTKRMSDAIEATLDRLEN